MKKMILFWAFAALFVLLALVFLGDGPLDFIQSFYRDLPFLSVVFTAAVVFSLSWWIGFFKYILRHWRPVAHWLTCFVLYVVAPLLLAAWFGGWL